MVADREPVRLVPNARQQIQLGRVGPQADRVLDPGQKHPIWSLSVGAARAWPQYWPRNPRQPLTPYLFSRLEAIDEREKSEPP